MATPIVVVNLSSVSLIVIMSDVRSSHLVGGVRNLQSQLLSVLRVCISQALA